MQGIGGAHWEIGNYRAPVIPRRHLLFVAGVLLQLQAEQASGIEGVLFEHAITEAVDGVDGGFVHPLGGGIQTLGTAGAVFRLAVVVEQFGQYRVVGVCIGIGKDARGIGQAVADPFAQFFGGRFGEGHHQNFRRQQRPREGIVFTMAEHQTQVEGGQGKGLAGAGAGFDQPGAVQRESDRERTFNVHALPPVVTA